MAAVFHGFEGFGIDAVVALAVGDGDVEGVAIAGERSEAGAAVGDGEGDGLAEEVEAGVADEGAGEESGLAEDLEAVADAEDGLATGGGVLDRAHDGGEAGDGTAAEVVAVGESAGDDDGFVGIDAGVLVPGVADGLLEDVADGVEGILVAIGSGELKNGKFHGRFTAKNAKGAKYFEFNSVNFYELFE